MSTRPHEGNGRRRVVLNFHGVGDIPSHVPDDERPYWLTTREFVAVMDEVRASSEATGPRFQVTLDDGNASDVTAALPVLMARGISASFFVCAGRLGRPGYLDAAQLRELCDAGMTVGSHGWGHVDWRRADTASLDRELRGARDRLSDVLGQAINDAAVPFGSYDRRVLRALRHHQYRNVYTSDRGWAGAGWIVPRETWEDGWGVDRLRAICVRRPSTRQRAHKELVRLAKRLR